MIGFVSGLARIVLHGRDMATGGIVARERQFLNAKMMKHRMGMFAGDACRRATQAAGLPCRTAQRTTYAAARLQRGNALLQFWNALCQCHHFLPFGHFYKGIQNV